ncbi:MAG TPA: malonyl-CoA decarboxylase [Caulobacteraceae bacterium]|jgi:malonyl-CoA decarboxylase
MGSVALSVKPTFLGGMLTAIFERSRALARRNARPAPEARPSDAGAVPALTALCAKLVSGDHGEASSVAMASEVLARWSALDTEGQREFLLALGSGFGPDPERLDRAIDAYRARPDAETVLTLHNAAEPPRQEVLRRLNLAPLGTLTLVRMREAALPHLGAHPALRALDADFTHLFSSCFNRGFLVLRRIDWSSPANILEKIIRYEAVHQIKDWSDLRRRLEPDDRRCFAFFHPQLVDEPLIFVEVALTRGSPDSIGALLGGDGAPDAAGRPDTAVFYSISNCQAGLRGISFGDFLIKQVVDELSRDLPELKTFITLSPVPGFAPWLAGQLKAHGDGLLSPEDQALLAAGLDDGGAWAHDAARSAELRAPLLRAAALYLLEAKTPKGKPLDPVARFHLNNGASLHRLNFAADTSPRGLGEAHGLMVNYRYELGEIEANHERLAQGGAVAASSEVRKLAAGASAAPRPKGKAQARPPA